MAFSNADIMLLRTKSGAGIVDCKKALTATNGDIEKAIETLRKKGLADLAKRAGRVTTEGVVSVKASADGSKVAMANLSCETDFVAKTPDFQKTAAEIADYVYNNPSDGDYTGDTKVTGMVTAVASKVGENMGLKGAVCMRAGKNGVVGYYVHTDNKKGAVIELTAEGISNTEGVLKVCRSLAMQAVAMSPRWVRREDVPADIIAKEREIYSEQARTQGKPEAAIVKMLEGRVRKFYEEVCLLDQASITDSKMSVNDYVGKLAAELGGKLNVVRFVKFG